MSVTNPTPQEIAAKQAEFTSRQQMENFYAANPQYNPNNQYSPTQQAAMSALEGTQRAAIPVNAGSFTTPSNGTVSALGSGSSFTLTPNAEGGFGITPKMSADAGALDTGTLVDNTKLNTQGGGSALTTGDVNKMSTSPAATSSPNTMNTGSIPALTTADLAAWGKTLPQGLTSDQLTAALKTQQDTLNKSYADALAGNQTAPTSQNANFLKDWNTSADALKNSILSGVDTKNQAFGTQATQGFMDAFKNFQIPTNQQTGVNLGNYNDNRNAAADQWWSQYVTGRR